MLSPDGNFVAYQSGRFIHAGNADAGYADLGDFSEQTIIRRIQWTGNNTFVIATQNRISRASYLWAFRLGLDDAGQFGKLEQQRHDVSGYVYDLLVNDPEHIVFAKLRFEDKLVATDLFRIDLFENSERGFKKSRALKTGADQFYYYLRDTSGEFSVGIRYLDSVPEVWRRAPGTDKWNHVWTAPDASEFEPAGISADGATLWALSNAFTDKQAAIEFDLERGDLRRVLFEHDRLDLESIVMSEHTAVPRAVIFREHGMVRYHFFADDARTTYEGLATNFPDRGVVVIGRSNDGAVQLVHSYSSADPGQIHRCVLADNSCELIASVAPWLEGSTLSESIALQIPSEEELVVDAFLTLPLNGGSSMPLIAMPHGGPIGVRDSRAFSARVQWLARRGYAVLQVNFRGSGGYGRDFEAAGFRQLGRGIEDDIEAAVYFALEKYPQLDGDRVGIYGGSYGGYSALMSVIRNPDLFVCAASWAGVTDLTLLFTQTDRNKNEALREYFTRLIGEPDLDYDEQTANSPVYRYREFRRPILLGHGTADRVVDVEHSWRLRMLLGLIDADPEFVILEDVQHGFEYVSEAQSFYEPLLDFLDEHLEPERRD